MKKQLKSNLNNQCVSNERKKHKAFTLIELIVVMAIIGVLTLLAIPKMTGYTEKARYTKLISTSKELERASERYFMDFEDWPRLTDDAYTSDEIHEFAKKVYDITGKEVTLDPAGNYYDIDYDKLSQFVTVPDDRMHYVLRNPVGKVYALDEITEEAENRVFASNVINILSNKENPTTQDELIWSYVTDGVVAEEEWQLDDGAISSTPPTGTLSQGAHTVKVRLKIDNRWSKWAQHDVSVSRIPENFVVNSPNSTAVNDSINYEINDALTFNYNNTNTLNWTVSVSGLYKIDTIAAGAGGLGARVQGEIRLNEGDVLNVKIHSLSNGGGIGGSPSTNEHLNSRGLSGQSGSGGTVVNLNNQLIVVAGGAGGTGGDGKGYTISGKGGIGGNGGAVTSIGNGNSGKASTYHDSFRNSTRSGAGGLGGTAESPSGKGGKSYSYTNGGNGQIGATIYDGAGGGSAGNGSSYYPGGAGGGGVGGRSFIDDTSVMNAIVTPGYNSGNGKVVLTLISK